MNRANDRILPSGYPLVMWNCLCDCGNKTMVSSKNLLYSKYPTRSCGCAMHEIRNNLSGRKFGRLQVAEKVKGKTLKSGYEQQTYKCLCDCGNEVIVPYSALTTGNTRSCGCLQKELTSQRAKTHGMSKTKIYNVWKEMKYRCANPNDKSYKYYGALGIKVCDDWYFSFEKFYEWAIENGYREGLEIDRIDGTKDYEPLNCRWATRMIQMNNIRTNRIIELFGVSHTVSEWAKLVDSNGDRILDRLKLGWDEYSSVFAPKYYNYNKLGGFNLDRKLFQEVIGNQCQ